MRSELPGPFEGRPGGRRPRIRRPLARDGGCATRALTGFSWWLVHSNVLACLKVPAASSTVIGLRGSRPLSSGLGAARPRSEPRPFCLRGLMAARPARRADSRRSRSGAGRVLVTSGSAGIAHPSGRIDDHTHQLVIPLVPVAEDLRPRTGDERMLADPCCGAGQGVPGVSGGHGLRYRLLLLPVGTWLALTRPAREDDTGRSARRIPAPVLVVLAAAVGRVGGFYGIGGGSILAPVLIGTGRRPSQVAPAALASTLPTSVAGVITFAILSIHEPGAVAPDWDTGIALGVGGLAGAYTGARLQSHLPDALIRRLVGVLVIAIGVRYLWSGLG
jgi:Sulfite exporter TauE/SafE